MDKEFEFKEFSRIFGGLFSPSELNEIYESWGDECRNAIILGIFDRRPRGRRDRERLRLIEWLDSHPDQWMLEFQAATGRRVGLREALAIPEEN